MSSLRGPRSLSPAAGRSPCRPPRLAGRARSSRRRSSPDRPRPNLSRLPSDLSRLPSDLDHSARRPPSGRLFPERPCWERSPASPRSRRSGRSDRRSLKRRSPGPLGLSRRGYPERLGLSSSPRNGRLRRSSSLRRSLDANRRGPCGPRPVGRRAGLPSWRFVSSRFRSSEPEPPFLSPRESFRDRPPVPGPLFDPPARRSLVLGHRLPSRAAGRPGLLPLRPWPKRCPRLRSPRPSCCPLITLTCGLGACGPLLPACRSMLFVDRGRFDHP